MNETIKWFFEKLMNDKQCFLYHGQFNNSLTAKIIKINEAGYTSQDESVKIKRRAVYLIGESFQNIIKHGDKEDSASKLNKKSEFFMTRSTDARHYITTGNLVKNSDAVKLRDQIDFVNTLNDDELNELYKQVIKNKTYSEKSGAGLGIIDMARKTDQKIKYLFNTYNQDTSLFYNQIEIRSESNQTMAGSAESIAIEQAVAFHSKMVDEQLIVLQKGDFSEESLIPLLKIFETNLTAIKLKSKILKRLYLVLIELLQNISKHGYGEEDSKQGIFSIAETKNGFIISAGNYIENKHIAPLVSHLAFINHKNNEELHLEYLERLCAENASGNKSSGMGLIKIARMLNHKIAFDFNQISDEISFFSISITLDSKSV